MDDTNSVSLQFNLWHRDGRLVDFVINVRVLAPGGWTDVERFDCCHGHCHLHADNDETAPRSLYRLDDVDDVARAFRKVEPMADKRARIIRDKGA
ncbi:DUF7718 family protein [Nocardia shimofusensis]|uniref:DUF7718 family protein n=1 Tax=Nocardia shimofusensis TaxID=228596 RepID=UPI00083041FA|nr:hypothetical protein [Nocardia shimofusensis]